jgi:RNA polymerase sigma-70 factor (ECF subfamily)
MGSPLVTLPAPWLETLGRGPPDLWFQESAGRDGKRVSAHATKEGLKPGAPVDPSNPRVSAIPADPKGPPEADDQELVAQCRGGDQRAFQALVERHHAAAYRVALRIVRSDRDAEEVAQDAFVAAWAGIRDFRGEAAFTTWLYRIVARRALDRAASLRSRRTRETPFADADPNRVKDGATGAAEAFPAARRVEWLLASLTEAQRAVIALFYYEDQSVKEIARILSLPEGTVKTHLARARAALRDGWLRAMRMEISDDLR